MKVPINKGGIFSFIFLVLFFLLYFLLPLNIILASNPSNLLIDRIQIVGDKKIGTSKEDYIRIYNNTDEDINLQEYKLVKRAQTGKKDSNIKSWKNTPAIIKAHEYYVWANNETKIQADTSNTSTISNNNGIAIKNRESGMIIDSVGWGDCQNDFVEIAPAKNPSFGNYLQRKNHIDTNDNSKDFEIIKYNSEKTIIPTEDKSTLENKNQVNFLIQKKPQIKSTIIFSDIPYTNIDADIEALKKNDNSNKETITKKKERKINNAKILINEILPNPIGIDNPQNCNSCGEFIELYNYGEDPINLSNWKIIVDKQKIYNFKYKIIEPKQTIAFYRQQTNLILQNSKGTIEFFSPEKLQQTVQYNLAEEGYSYSLVEGSIPSDKKWVWSKKISPGEFNYWLILKNKPPIANFYLPEKINLKKTITIDASDSYDPENDNLNFSWNFGDGQTSKQKNPTHLFTKAGLLTVQLTINDGENSVIAKKKINVIGKTVTAKLNKKEGWLKPRRNKRIKYKYINKIKDLKEYQSGQKIIVTGIVIASPNILSNQYFYISDLTGGIQIYNYKKLFPKLYLGDEIKVQGELTKNNNEQRIKITNQSDIKIINQKHPLESIKINNDIDSNLIAKLITIQGEIIEKQNNNIYLSNKNLDNEIIIYLKKGSNLTSKNFNLGDEIKITGIVQKIGTKFKILPREFNDLEIIKNKNPQVLGKKIINEVEILKNNSNLIIPPKIKQTNLFQYLFIFTIGIIIILIVWIIRLKKKI